jgi:HlyD family secretion protein
MIASEIPFAALDAATANRNNVYAGMRAEQIATLAAEIAKTKSRLQYAEQQLNRIAYLARSDTATQQSLDQATNDVAAARADIQGRRSGQRPAVS